MMRWFIGLIAVFVSVSVMAGLTSPSDVASNTLGLWNMDDSVTAADGKVLIDNVSGNVDLDLYTFDGDSGNGYGATLVAGKYNNALQFDGANDRAKSRRTFTTDSSIRVEGWIYIDSDSAGSKNWLVSVQGIFLAYFESFDATEGTARLNVTVSTQSGTGVPTVRLPGIPMGQWIYVSIGFENEEVFVDVDGVGRNSYAATGEELKQALTWLRIGSNTDSNSELFKGMMDDMHITMGAASLDPYVEWLVPYAGSLSSSDQEKTADPDGDTMNNFMEYALGGNPTTSDAAAVLPVSYMSGGDLMYVYNRRTNYSALGLSYSLESTPDLTASAFSNDVSVYVENGTSSPVDGFEAVTNSVGTASSPVRFVTLVVEEQ